MAMSTFYALLDIHTTASQEEIDTAYAYQRERYNPDRVASMGDEIRQTAEQRLAELERIYQVLSDPERRRQYDVSIGLAAPEQFSLQQSRRGLSTREIWYTAGGMLAALALIALIWTLTGREETQLPAVGEVNRPAPDFTLPALGGGEVRLSDYHGDIVLVNFWGTWCEPCRREMPALQASYEQLRDQGFVIIGVNLADDEKIQGRTEADILSFAEQYGVTYPVALDVKGEVANAFRLYPLPTSYFIDAQGHIRYVRVGEVTLDEVKALFTQLKQETVALSR